MLPIDKKQAVRLIVSALDSLGYSQSASALANESGVEADSRLIKSLKKALLDGDWTQVDSALDQIRTQTTTMNSGTSKTTDLSKVFASIRMLILEQRFLELVEADQMNQASAFLSTQMAPLADWSTIERLSCHLLCENANQLKQWTQWDGAKGQSRGILLNRILGMLPVPFSIPPDRLWTLLDQSIKYQVSSCEFHNAATMPTIANVLEDHHCTREDERVNSSTIQCCSVLDAHKDEVLHVAFAHSSLLFASASADKSVIVWQLFPQSGMDRNSTEKQLSKSELSSSTNPFSFKLLYQWNTDTVQQFVCWSDDDQFLLARGHHTRTVYCWNLARGQNGSPMLFECDGIVSALAFYPLSLAASQSVSTAESSSSSLSSSSSFMSDVSSSSSDSMVLSPYFSASSSSSSSLFSLISSHSASSSSSLSSFSLSSFSSSSSSQVSWSSSSSTSSLSSSSLSSLTFISSTSFRPDAPFFITGSLSKTLSIWVLDLSILSNNKMAVLVANSTIRIYNLVTGTCESSWTEAKPSCIVCASNDNLLVSTCQPALNLWNAARQSLIRSFIHFRQKRLILRPDCNDEYVVCGGEDSKILVWKRANGKDLASCVGHSGPVNSVSVFKSASSRDHNKQDKFSPNVCLLFVSASDDGTVRVWACSR